MKRVLRTRESIASRSIKEGAVRFPRCEEVVKDFGRELGYMSEQMSYRRLRRK